MIIRGNETISTLPHMWSKCIGAGRACEGLRAHWQEQLTLIGLAPGATFVLERMALEDTAIHAWEQMGRPRNLTRAQEALLKACAPRKEELCADAQGTLALELTLAPWEIVCLYQQ